MADLTRALVRDGTAGIDVGNLDALADSPTIVRNLGTPDVVSLDAQVAAILLAANAYVQSNTTVTKQNDLVLTSTTRVFSWRGSSLGIISGFTGGSAYRRLTVCNDSNGNVAGSEAALILEPNSTNSTTAADRIITPGGFAIVLMPGDQCELLFSEFANRWFASPRSSIPYGLQEWSDFAGALSGPFLGSAINAGTVGNTTFGVDATEKAKGVVLIGTGTNTNGGYFIGHSSTGNIALTTGASLAVGRIARGSNAPDGTNTFTNTLGFQDGAGGTLTDGVVWEQRWNGSAEEWCPAAYAAGTPTRGTTPLPTPDNTFIVVGIASNADGSRYDTFYSQDSMSFTKGPSLSTGLPSVTQLAGFGVCTQKSAGGTARNCVVDYMGYRLDGVRG